MCTDRNRKAITGTVSVEGAGAAVPEPTKVGAGLVLLGAAATWMDGNEDGGGGKGANDDDEMDC